MSKHIFLFVGPQDTGLEGKFNSAPGSDAHWLCVGFVAVAALVLTAEVFPTVSWGVPEQMECQSGANHVLSVNTLTSRDQESSLKSLRLGRTQDNGFMALIIHS